MRPKEPVGLALSGTLGDGCDECVRSKALMISWDASVSSCRVVSRLLEDVRLGVVGRDTGGVQSAGESGDISRAVNALGTDAADKGTGAAMLSSTPSGGEGSPALLLGRLPIGAYFEIQLDLLRFPLDDMDRDKT